MEADVCELTMHLRYRCYILGLKKQGSYLYAPFPEAGEYRRECSIKEFLYRETKMTVHLNLWVCLTRFRGTVKQVVAELERDDDSWPLDRRWKIIRLRYPM